MSFLCWSRRSNSCQSVVEKDQYRRIPAIQNVAFLIYPGFQILDLAGPLAAFDVANVLSGCELYRCHPVALSARVEAHGGLVMHARRLRSSEPADVQTLIVTGGPGADDPSTAARVARQIPKAAGHCHRLASVCTGALLLGQAGYLAGRRCTTHWAYADRLASVAPTACIEVDRIFVEDAGIWTSAGMTAGIDMALAMIAADHGNVLARNVSRSLVVYFRRPGGQSQFSRLLEMQTGDTRIERAHAWVVENLSRRITVQAMSDAAGMSERQFSRLYLRQTGMTPAKGIECLRIEHARALFASSNLQVQQVARDCGFGTAETMRAAFQRQFGVPPQFMRHRLNEEY